MKKLLKLGIFLVCLLLVLVVAGTLIVGAYANQIAKKAIEQGGTYALGVDTKVNDVKLGLLSGEFGLNGLDVANPAGAGHTSPHFLGLGHAEVKVDYSALQQPVVKLPRLALDAIDVSLEKRGGKANYQTILDNLKKLESGSSPTPQPQPSGSEKKFVIQDLSITNVTIHVDMLDAGGLSQVAKLTIPLDKIQLSNVGQTGTGVQGTGVTMKELVSIVVQAVLGAATQKAGDILPGELLSDLQGQLGQLSGLKDLPMQVTGDLKNVVDNLGKDVGKKAEEAAKDVGKKIEDVTKGVGDALKNPFGGDKKKEDKK